MNTVFDSKRAARQYVWDRLEREGIARFPYPPHGRIPNFEGAEAAARRLFENEPWHSARRLKVNPDSPQAYVRCEALRRGIVIYVPTPRLTGGFYELDPRAIPATSYHAASRLDALKKWAQPVALREMPQMDAIVTGSAAVTCQGKRCGKGAGYSDIEFAILRELGHEAVPVATTVHDVQVVADFPLGPNDLPLSLIATPTTEIRIAEPLPAPRRIQWDLLSAAELRRMPLLLELKALLGSIP